MSNTDDGADDEAHANVTKMLELLNRTVARASSMAHAATHHSRDHEDAQTDFAERITRQEELIELQQVRATGRRRVGEKRLASRKLRVDRSFLRWRRPHDPQTPTQKQRGGRLSFARSPRRGMRTR